MVKRRPRRSVNVPAARAPTMAPSVTQLVIISITNVLGWKSFLMPSRAPEMTPWSYPNRRPASITTAAMANRYRLIP
jgi:hypothetical protein